MNNELYTQAQTAYNATDYATALQLYAQCMQSSAEGFHPGEMGLLCHQIGNCLMKLEKVEEAINAYSQATADASYDSIGAVNCNLGFAYAHLHDYENAVRYFELAASDAKYDARFKANAGMGNALLKLGKTAEAGVAFRDAALDEANPDPTKALLNLGICFMTLNRPADAVTSYESALQFPMKAATRNKLYANLGQAYVASGLMQKGVTAFENALADKTYFLSDSASVDYQRAIGAVAQGTAEIPMTTEMDYADASGFDVVSDEYDAYSAEAAMAYEPSRYDQDDLGGSAGNYLTDGSNMADGGQGDAFFNATDEDVEAWARNIEVQKKKRHGVGFKVFIAVAILLVIALGVGVFAYTQGLGIPSQETVIQKLFANPTGNANEVLAKGISDSEKKSIAASVVTDSSATIEGINKSMMNSTAYVSAKTSQGGTVRYEVTLERDMIGWKISGVTLYFISQN